jgi:tetratricopeptide (TPR) repeat protein
VNNSAPPQPMTSGGEPTNSETYLIRGIARAERGDLDGAVTDLSRSVQLNPRNAQSYYFRGVVWERKKNVTQAREDFNLALALDPGHSKAKEKLSPSRAKMFLETVLGHMVRAGGILDAEADASILKEMDLIDRENAITELRALHFVKSRKNTLEVTQIGNRFHSRLIRKEAYYATYSDHLPIFNFLKTGAILCVLISPLIIIGDKLALDNRVAAAYYGRAVSQIKAGNNEEALSDLNKAASISPAPAQVFALRGSLLLTGQDYDNALIDFDKSLALNPNNAPVYLGRAAVFERKKNYELALSDIDQVLSLSSDGDVVAAAFGLRGHIRLSQHDEPQAIEDFSRFLFRYPQNFETLSLRAASYEKQGDIDRAISDYSRALQIVASSEDASATREVSRLRAVIERLQK